MPLRLFSNHICFPRIGLSDIWGQHADPLPVHILSFGCLQFSPKLSWGYFQVHLSPWLLNVRVLRVIRDPLQALPSNSSSPSGFVWTFLLLLQPQCSLGQLRAVAPIGIDGGCCLIPHSALPLLLHGTKLASRSSWNSSLGQSVLTNGSSQGGRMEIQGFSAGGHRISAPIPRTTGRQKC